MLKRIVITCLLIACTAGILYRDDARITRKAVIKFVDVTENGVDLVTNNGVFAVCGQADGTTGVPAITLDALRANVGKRVRLIIQNGCVTAVKTSAGKATAPLQRELEYRRR